MTNANSFHSALIVLVMFGVIYFAALGIFELKKLLTGRKNRKDDDR